MMSLEEQNLASVIAHLRNIPFNQMADYSSIEFT